jgi:hypothetical protein
MLLRPLCAGLALAATVLAAGCCHKCQSCGRPAVVGTAPVAAPCPGPCGPAPAVNPPPPPVPAYSVPAPPCGLPR